MSSIDRDEMEVSAVNRRCIAFPMVLALSALVAACQSSSSATPSPTDDAGSATDSATTGDDASGIEGGSAGADANAGTIVAAFDAVQISFTPTEDHRHVRKAVTFPGGKWKQVNLHLTLQCPSGKCDIWDRWGSLGIVNQAGTTESITELARFVTPYAVGADWTLDLTSIQSLLAGDLTLEAFIDTWVGPGHPQGNGWMFGASFTFVPGALDPEPAQVIRLWDLLNVEVGDPAMPPSVAPASVQIPADAARVELRSLITGHGQGNLTNCAEFCPKTHTYSVGGMPFAHSVWRVDCASTAVRPQGGAYPFVSRAGWCPGAMVVPWVTDVTAAVAPGMSVMATYAPEAYENTCRPTATTCQGCLAGSCAYDSGGHTPPNYNQSALLVVYRNATAAL